MTAAPFDADRHLEQQRLIWDSVSPAWQRWQPDFEHGAAEVTRRLLDLAGPIHGRDVLDVGSGIGEPAITAAAAASGGRVVGVDLSPEMVALARTAGAAHHNLSFLVGDLESLGLPAASFDVAVSRWALPFAADRARMLREIGRLLRPKGTLVAAVWGEPHEVPAISLAFRVISRELDLEPPPPGPGPFAMADPEELCSLLEQSGFRDVQVTNQVVPFRFATTREFARFSRDVLPPGMRKLLAERTGSVDDANVWDAFREAAASFEDASQGVFLPSITRCFRAVVDR